MPDKMQAFLDFDEKEVRAFVGLIGLPLTVLAIDSQRSDSGPVACTCQTADEVVRFARERNKKQLNIYWLVNVASVQDKKPAKSDMNSARFLWADCDPDIAKYGSYEAARGYLLTEHLPKLIDAGASFVIDSGNGLQPFFRLTALLSCAGGYTEYENLNRRLGEAFDGPGTFNVERIMRLPGTLNWPNKAKLNKGYPKEPNLGSLLFSDPDRKYAPMEIKMLLRRFSGKTSAATKTSAARPRAAKTTSAADEHQRFESLLTTDTDLRSRWEGSADDLKADGRDTSGSGLDLSLFSMLRSRNFDDDTIIEIMLPWEYGSKDVRREERDSHYWNQLRKNAKGRPSALTPKGKAIAELNKRYALVKAGASAFVLDEAESPIDLLKPDTFRLMLANQTVDVQLENGTKKMPVAEAWLKDQNRRQYERIEFAPGGAREGSYNLFRGWAVARYESMTVEQAAAKCGLLLAHIKNNVCRGDAEQYDYLLRWYAHMFQNPSGKPGVLVAVRGEKGVGKSKVTEAIAALLGPHSSTVSQPQHLTGNFNAHHAQALLIVAEEAVWAGDKQAESALKHMITSPTMTLERKGVDPIQVTSCARFVMNSNAEWVFPASADERRLFALECGNRHRQDHPYFKAIDDQLYGPGLDRHHPGQESPGLRALLTLLLGLDLADFNVRKVPETDALKAQRAASLRPHEEFMKQNLEEHSLDGNEWTEADMLIPKTELYRRYLRYMADRHKAHPATQEQFAQAVKTMFGWATQHTRQERGRARTWAVSGWSQSRTAFEEAMKVRIYDE